MGLARFFNSTVGQKIVMAVTGILLFGFVLVHMSGNWLVFAGSDAINSYAYLLKSKPLLLWSFRLGLLAVVILHVWSAVSITLRNRAARTQGYEDPNPSGATVASRTMMITGSIVLIFIVFHLLHFTVGWIKPEYFALHDEERHDVFGMVVKSFQVPWIATFYVLGVACLGFHLSHGLMSMFRSLGLANPAYARAQKLFALIFASLIFVGMAVIPLSIAFHLYPRGPLP